MLSVTTTWLILYWYYSQLWGWACGRSWTRCGWAPALWLVSGGWGRVHYTTLQYSLQHCTQKSVQGITVQKNSEQWSVVKCSAIECSTVQYSRVQCSTAYLLGGAYPGKKVIYEQGLSDVQCCFYCGSETSVVCTSPNSVVWSVMLTLFQRSSVACSLYEV